MLQSLGELVGTSVPGPKIVQQYLQDGLAVDEHNGQPLEFRESWSQAAVDQWFRRILPKPFEWLDARFGIPEDGEFHWVLLRRDQRALFVVRHKASTGVELSKAKGTAARNPSQWNVRIGQ